MNVSSIAGHMTSSRNSDYSASKFALTGFLDALRQEMLGSEITITNFYPYYINTGLFEGFQPKLGFILPTLDAKDVVETMFTSIMAEHKEVYINPIIYWLKTLGLLLPLNIRLIL